MPREIIGVWGIAERPEYIGYIVRSHEYGAVFVHSGI
jgi:hypothetical protein